MNLRGKQCKEERYVTVKFVARGIRSSYESKLVSLISDRVEK